MSIELRRLRCFLAIAEESGVTRAAARPHLTQPTVSRTLAALEKHLGTRLVDRSTHHLAVTAEGTVFPDPGRPDDGPGHPQHGLGPDDAGPLPPSARPTRTLTVANTDDWLTAMAAGRGTGVSVSSTSSMHPHPGVTYRPLSDAPPAQVVLAWRTGAGIRLLGNWRRWRGRWTRSSELRPTWVKPAPGFPFPQL